MKKESWFCDKCNGHTIHEISLIGVVGAKNIPGYVKGCDSSAKCDVCGSIAAIIWCRDKVETVGLLG